ncbi:MAG TPA: DNA repair protein RecN [Solirubrobacteraceae bacterium]|nr:DNA repair protein RecN [Solirubrobacteraceae bacterium]
MLHELRVENLLLVERAELRLAAGLNVITGETGAGKTMLARALDLLLGGRAGSGIVRAGASEAYVEGVFARPARLEHPVLDRIPEDAEELVLGRRVWPDGRTRAYLCGRSVGVADLRDLGERLLSFYGQHEHRKLMLGAAQLDILDRHCGLEALRLRDRVSQVHARVRGLEREREALAELAGARERELDLLNFELAEIEGAGPAAAEWDALTLERSRLQHLDALQMAAGAGVEALDGEGGAGEAVARAAGALETIAGIDPALEPLLARARSLSYEAQDLAAELRRYGSDIEAAPGQLEEVEERLALLSRLMRKYGGSVEAVLSHAEQCRHRRDELERAEVRIEEVQAALEQAQAELERDAQKLTELRREAAPGLAEAVRARLGELAMAEADFQVQVRPREDGCGARGADVVEMVIAPNPGIPAGPLREIASGGELSRVMLALLSVAHGGGVTSQDGEASGEPEQAPLLVFDEIDSGVGGHTARAVGEHLRQLAQGRQVLCITHLPQVAALAERHFTIAKEGTALPARATVRQLEGEAVVAEVVRMLGATQDDRAAGRHARELLRQAA